MFKSGDYVKIKPNTVLFNGEVAENWVGEVDDFFEEENMYLVLLDAITIDQLSDKWILESLEEGGEPFMEFFSADQLELTARRDTDSQIQKALERLADRAIDLEEQIETERNQHNQTLMAQFEQSVFFKDLTDFEQEQSTFILQSFIDGLYVYEHVTINELSLEGIKNCCLDIVPSTLVADKAVFEVYGTVVRAFLQFLKSQNLLSDADAIIHIVEKISPQIPQKAQKSSNWTTEKHYLMQAKAKGIEFKDQEEANDYVLEQVMASNKISSSYSSNKVSLPKISRNEKITVQYEDGRIVEGVKFKKVKNDLEDGLCTILR